MASNRQQQQQQVMDNLQILRIDGPSNVGLGHLVHSFTDDFISEHCPAAQHVDGNIADNQRERLKNCNNNNNNNNYTINNNLNVDGLSNVVEAADGGEGSVRHRATKARTRQSRNCNHQCTLTASNHNNNNDLTQEQQQYGSPCQAVGVAGTAEEEEESKQDTITVTNSEQVSQPISHFARRSGVTTASTGASTCTNRRQHKSRNNNTAGDQQGTALNSPQQRCGELPLDRYEANNSTTIPPTTNSAPFGGDSRRSKTTNTSDNDDSDDGDDDEGSDDDDGCAGNENDDYEVFAANVTHTPVGETTVVSRTRSVGECCCALLRESRSHASARYTVDNSASTYATLTPNKCLAELERLYEEFRASESVIAQSIRATSPVGEHPPGGGVATSMRLNVPALAETVRAADSKLAASSSSVFLTTTNSVTAHTKPCQRQPSLTIQVNTHPNYSSQGPNRPIVNTNDSNAVSVVSCNFVNNISNNTNEQNVGGVSVNSGTRRIAGSGSSEGSSGSLVPKLLSESAPSGAATRNIPNDARQAASAASAKGDDNSNGVSVIQVSATPRAPPRLPPLAQCDNAETGTTEAMEATGPTTPTAARTFISTECQTDDTAAVQLRAPPQQHFGRDQRRRERRERRLLQQTHSLLVTPTHFHPHLHPHHQHQHPNQRHHQSPHHLPLHHLERHSMPATLLHPPPHMHHAAVAGPPQTASSPSSVTMPAAMTALLRPMLPDILHNHFPPPYSALSLSAGGGNVSSPAPPPPPPPNFIGPPALPPPGLPGPPGPPGSTTLLQTMISTVPLPGTAALVSDGRFTLPLPFIRRSPSERSGKGCCGQWFAGPPLRALIAVVALGGVACALGGAALGATGLAGPPSSHLTAALLMIGVGVVLVTVSGAAWRMTAPGGPPCLGLGTSVDLARCGRRPCGRGGGAPHGLLYPEFQHRPPPPSYQASMQEYRLRLLLLDRDRQNGVVRGNSPPPTYRSHVGSLLRAPLTSTIRVGGTGGGSLAGSEYSFPPSYRSRNATPALVSGERSIETAPSGRLLANEDIPEPLSVEQLSEYNSLQQQHHQHQHQQKVADNNLLTTSVSVEIESSPPNISNRNSNNTKLEVFEKPNSSESGGGNGGGGNGGGSSGGKELVTIVTISQANDAPNLNNKDEQIEILAHL